jgi:hypothetical protein
MVEDIYRTGALRLGPGELRRAAQGSIGPAPRKAFVPDAPCNEEEQPSDSVHNRIWVRGISKWEWTRYELTGSASGKLIWCADPTWSWTTTTGTWPVVVDPGRLPVFRRQI